MPAFLRRGHRGDFIISSNCSNYWPKHLSPAEERYRKGQRRRLCLDIHKYRQLKIL